MLKLVTHFQRLMSAALLAQGAVFTIPHCSYVPIRMQLSCLGKNKGHWVNGAYLPFIVHK